MTDRINSGQGTLGRLLNDDAMAKSLARRRANLEEITGRLKRGEGTAGKLLTDKELYDRLNQHDEQLDQVSRRPESRRGTAGQLLQDQQLYENMNRTVANCETARGHPQGSEEISAGQRQHFLEKERSVMSNNGNSAGRRARGVRARRVAGAAVACSTHRPPARRRAGSSRRRRAKGATARRSMAREGREFLNRQRDNLTAAVERGREAFDQARKETL